MKVEYYNPSLEKAGCVVRSLSKALNIEYDVVKKELQSINENYNEVEVFEKYLFEHGFIADKTLENEIFGNSNYEGLNLVFMYEGDWYHMVCVIDNVIYDKFDLDKLKNMKIIKVYKKY